MNKEQQQQNKIQPSSRQSIAHSRLHPLAHSMYDESRGARGHERERERERDREN